MQEITNVLNTAKAPKREQIRAQGTFLRHRQKLWQQIYEERFPKVYTSTGNRKFVGAPARTALRCDFLLACKIALGSKFKRDRIADLAQRDLLFGVLRYREVFPNRRGKKFYCCPKCTGKLYECVSAKVFHYIDNAKWRTEIEADGTKQSG